MVVLFLYLICTNPQTGKIMKKVIFYLLFLAAFASAAVVSPSQSTMAILLDASGLCGDTSNSWSKLNVQEFLKNHAFYGDANSIYCRSYDESMTPSEAADSLFKGPNSIFNEVAKQNVASNLSRFVIIAEGAAGLAVREYIQSKDYQGEIDNVIFFNTPHEGTGFADQALLNGSSALNKSKSVSDYSDIIPLALAIYLVGGSEALETLMMSLLKEAVLGMVQDAGGIKGKFNDYFKNKDESYKSLLYLAQDLDLNDKAYDEVKSEAINKGLNLKEYVGSTQLLNSYSKLNSFDHPAYNNVFSYGLPTIGNGRRTLADFADQSKNHVDKEQLQKFLTESVVSTLKGKGKEVVEGEIDRIISQALDGDFAANVMQTANQIASKYNVAVGQISECIRDVSALSRLKFNKENLSKSVLTVIRIANKYLPEKYKSELYSTFIDEYSEKVSDLMNQADSIKAELRKGMDVVSNNLSNYAINFFDEGTFNVPAFSAIGKNVQAFKESSVTRVGYSLNKFVQENKTKYSELNNYIEHVSKVGELEKIRQDIDEGLKYGCEAAELVGAGEICRAGQFIANVALIAKVSVDIGKAMEMVHSLESAKYIAVEQSLKSKPKYSSWTDREGRSHDIEFSDMENMLFGTPVVSLQTVRVKDSAESIIPLVLYKKMGDIKDYEGVSKDPAAYAYSFPESEFTEISRNHLTNSNSVMVKDVHSEWKDGRLLENARYAALDAFTVRNFIQEYRFIIDDFQPDSLRLIKFDFNAREQVAYERDGNTWYIYRGKANHWDPVAVDTLSESPVQKDGLFVIQPKDVLNRGVTNEKDSLLLSAVQEDGANSVSIYVVNKAGYANNQRITFKFQAVDYILDEGWPKSFERVSRMDTVDFYSNDWGYGASLGQYRLIVMSSQDVDTVKVSVDSLHGNGARYRFWADLSPIWKKHPLKDTVYTLKWDLGFKTKTLKEDGSTGEQLRNYSPQVTVLGDVSAPKLAFDTSYTPKVVSLNNNGILAYVINQDSADNRVLRGLRSYMVHKNIKDTLLYRANVGEPAYEIRWDKGPVTWSDSVDLYVQAYDLANPDSVIKKALLGVTNDSAKSSWSLVLEDDSASGDTTFKSGINGISLHKKVLVDNDVPQMVKENITFRSAADADLPVFSRQKNGADLLLNAKDTLMVSFDVEENLLGRDTETISVELVFKDSLGNGEVKFKRYLSDFVVRNSLKRFVFEELDVDRLDDGVYSLTVSLTDEAGNRSEKRIMEKLRVDRTSPQVHGVSLGDVAYKNVAELKKGTAHLSQSIDDARNRSSLACYVKVDVNNNVGKWVGPVAETVSKDALYSNYEFDIRGAASDTSKGFWYVYFGCYDEAGNFGKNMNFMGMGSRYPQITYPQSGSGSYVDQILIRGIAPNPDVQGNSNKGMFSITWQKQGDSTWSEKGIDYLVFDRSLALTERDLAVWNTSGLNLDDRSYILKLSVKSCDSCEWVSNERTVAVDAFVAPDTANAPKIVITPPVGTHVAGQVKDVSIELRNVPDTSKWFVSATIEAPSPKDSTVYVKTVGKVFDPMAISPFRTPAAPSDTGLSIWQEDDDSTWHVRYVGNAKGSEIRNDSSKNDSAILRMTPYLAIRFVDGRIDWSTSAKADSSDLLGFMMDSIKVKNEFVDMDVPPYNMTKMWKVGTDSVHLKFKTTSPFTVDASLIEGVLYRDTLSPVVYIFPEKYKAHVAWDGLVNGASSRGRLVKMSVVAYEKGNEKNIISQDAEWYLEYEKTGIEFSSNNLNQYYINFLGTGLDSAEMKLGDYGFQFKLTGRSAYVTAKILDSAKTEVYTLLDSEFVFATSTNQWKTLRWNGENNDHFYKEGSYNVHVLVENETGVIIDTLYPFEVSLGENIKEARIDSVGRIADLKMLEASLDSNGKYRYVGKPDYILRTNVSATVLPKSARTFDYEWDVYGTQKPTLYKKTRPSLGIRRHRDEFWATVVTLVMSETRVYQISYSGWEHVCYQKGPEESRGYWYRMDVKKVPFRKNEKNVEISVDLDPERDVKSRVYGYLNNSNDPAPEILHNLVAIKILPASSYEMVKSILGYDATYFSNAVWDASCSSSDDLPWDSVYNKRTYISNIESKMFHWFNNWNGQPLYYEAVNDNFDITTNSAVLNNTFNSKSTKTICQADDLKDTVLAKNDSKFVCGAKMAKDEVDTSVITQFNPHAYMMNVKLKPFDKEKSFVIADFDKKYCSEMDNSGTDIKVKFVLEIDSNYWDPPTDRWGTNNLANRYVRFDPLNQTLYGDEGYIRKLKNISNPPDSNFRNFYNGSTWTIDTTFNNGPTVFETQRLWMWPVAENPLMFNDEIDTTRLNQDPNLYPEVKFYSSEYSWRFYCAKCDVAYKAEARSLLSGDLLAQFLSKDGLKGDKTIRKKISLPYDIYFSVAPVMTFDEARNAGIIISGDAVKYPLGDETSCSSDTTSGYRFYGCDKWVSRVHMERHDWDDSLWESTFTLANNKNVIRNPLTDPNVVNVSLTSVGVPHNETILVDKHQSHIVKTTEWNEQENRWSIELNKTDSDVDKLGGISIDKYELNYDKTSGWKIDTNNSKIGEGKYKLYHVGRQTEPSIIDFYRSRDTVFTSEKSLNNRLAADVIPLVSVVAQSSNPADTILSSKWAKNPSADVLGVFKRNIKGDTVLHPYLNANYDSASSKFTVTRNSLDIYASREDEIVTLQGSVPYDINNWSISYIQNGMRFKVADGTQAPIEATMNVSQLQGNTSFFLTYNVLGDITNYRQLDVHIGEHVKANETSDVYSMYGNVNIHFEKNAWEKDEDVTVRTMDPKECYDCDLFRNMVPVGPVLEVQPSHKFPEGKEPIVTVDLSMATLKKDNIDYRNVKIYKLDPEIPKLIPLEMDGGITLLDSALNVCKLADSSSCAIVRVNAKTPTFSEFVVLDSLKADSIVVADSIPEEMEQFSCGQMDALWMDTLWMGSVNGWLEFPYLCDGKSNYLLQLSVAGNVSAEHRGASTRPMIVWSAQNTDFNVLDSMYQSSIVFYGVDGNTEQKLGPVVRLDSVAPVIESVETSVSENEDGSRIVHVETEIEEIGSGISMTTMELFLGGNLLQSVTIPEDHAPVYDFVVDKKALYGCVGCMATIKVIVKDKGHNSDEVVRQTEKLYPYPSSLVLWYPFDEGSGKFGYEVMAKDNAQRMHMDLTSVENPWNGRYGVHLFKAADSASSRQYKLAKLDSLRPFTFEFNYSAGNTQHANWAILSFVGKNEWTFGVGTYNRYFLKVGTELYYFNTKRDANIPTHLVVVVNGKNVNLYKNGEYVETVRLGSELLYGGSGRLSIGARGELRSAVGNISNLRFYSSALTATQIQGIYNGILSDETINIEAVRAVALADRNGLIVDQSCSAPGKAYLRQKSVDNSGVMIWHADLKSDNYSLYILHRNYVSEDSKVEIFVNGNSAGTYKLTSTGLWKSEKVAGVTLNLKTGVNEIGIRPLGNLGIAALALASTSANIDGNQIGYNEQSWTNPEPKAKVFMKYEAMDDKKWAQVRFDMRNQTDQALENAKIRYYYKGEGENVNAVSFYPNAPMSVVNDAGSVFYAEFALPEAIAAYGTVYSGQGPLIGLHRLTSPNDYFPYWDKTDDPSYLKQAETEYVEATGVALLDGEGNLLNEFACYDEDGPMQKAKIKVRVMAKDNSYGSSSVSDIAAYVENIGNAPVNGFEMRYYFRDTAKTDLDINWSAFATNSNVNAGGDLYYISFMYDVILNSGDKSDYGSGVQFALHHPNRTNDFNAADDPSHHNLNNSGMVEADSIVVLDRRGNLLWGGVPQPKFSAEYVTKETYADLVRRDGDVIYVDIEENGYYTLETVNAIGIPLKTLYKGTWNVGEHSVTIDLNSQQPSSFIVLRKGTEILSWSLLN